VLVNKEDSSAAVRRALSSVLKHASFVLCDENAGITVDHFKYPQACQIAQENWLAALTYYIGEKPIAYSQHECGFTSACQRTLRIKRK
jgi:hypothetical protein